MPATGSAVQAYWSTLHLEECRCVDLVLRSDEQQSIRFERIVEQVEYSLTHFGLQPREEISADDEVDVAEGGVLEQIVGRKQNDVPNAPVHSVKSRLAREEALEAIRGDRGG